MDFGLLLQIVACAVTMAATWAYGNKSTFGPALSIVSALCFAAVNGYAGLWLCALFSASMAAMNARNYFKWQKETV